MRASRSWGLLLILFWATAGHTDTQILEENDQRVVTRTSVEYQMGEGDSVVDARKVALAKAKRLATEKAGTYLESRLEIEGSEVSSREVTAIAAGYLQAEVKKEDLSTGDDLQRVYHLTLQAEVDKRALREKVQDLREDPQKDARIEKLQTRNDELEQRLNTLTQRIQDVKDARAEELFKQREQVLTQITQNRDQVKKTMEGGTLLDLVNQGERKWKKIKRQMRSLLWPMLREHSDFELGRMSASRNDDGTSDVSVIVKAGIENEKSNEALQWLSEYLDFYIPWGNNSLDQLNVLEYNNEGARQKTAHTKRIFDRIHDSRFGVQVKLGDRRQFVSLIEKGSGIDRGEMYFILNKKVKVQFEGVSDQELRNLNGVEAKWFAEDPSGIVSLP